jgi:uncharacterized protein DUF4160
MYAEDHNPSHVRVIGPDFQAKVRIADAKVFAGAIPRHKRREAMSWISMTGRSCWQSGTKSNEKRAVGHPPRIKSVSAAREPWTLTVTWVDGTKDRVDLTGLIYRSPHFRIFLDHPTAFRRVRLADFGGGME